MQALVTVTINWRVITLESIDLQSADFTSFGFGSSRRSPFDSAGALTMRIGAGPRSDRELHIGQQEEIDANATDTFALALLIAYVSSSLRRWFRCIHANAMQNIKT